MSNQLLDLIKERLFYLGKQLENEINVIKFEIFMRLLRARYTVEQAICRHAFFRRVFATLKAAVGSPSGDNIDYVFDGPYKDILTEDIKKHYIGILANQAESNVIELDSCQMYLVWKKALELSIEHYQKSKAKIYLDGMYYLDYMTAEEKKKYEENMFKLPPNPSHRDIYIHQLTVVMYLVRLKEKCDYHGIRKINSQYIDNPKSVFNSQKPIPMLELMIKSWNV